jgi:hypothetical protein
MNDLIAHSSAFSFDLFLNAIAQGSLSGFVRVSLPDDRCFRLVVRNGCLVAAWGHNLGAQASWDEKRIHSVQTILSATEVVYGFEAAEPAEVRTYGVTPLPMMAVLLESFRRIDEARSN